MIRSTDRWIVIDLNDRIELGNDLEMCGSTSFNIAMTMEMSYVIPRIW